MRYLPLALLWLTSIGVASYALASYTLLTPGTTVHPAMKAVYAEHRVGILAHVIASFFTLLLGPAQFTPAIRARWPRVHRTLGRLYLAPGVLVGGAAGLYMAFHAYGGPVSTAGFATLALLWLATGYLAYRAARQRRFLDHRNWMVCNFAITFAAVTLRVQLGVCAALDLRFDDFYPVLAWSSWVPNILIAYLLARKSP
jgi:hypothetical protein